MSITVYVVLTEDPYGGSNRQVFSDQEAAEVYRLEVIAKLQGIRDVIIHETQVDLPKSLVNSIEALAKFVE